MKFIFRLVSFSFVTVLLLSCSAAPSKMRRPPLDPGQLATPSRLMLILVDGLTEGSLAQMPALSSLRQRGISFRHWSPDHLPLTPLTAAATLATGVYPHRYVTPKMRQLAMDGTKPTNQQTKTLTKLVLKTLPSTLAQQVSGLGAGVSYAIGNGPTFIRPFTRASFEIEPLIRPKTEPNSWVADEVIRRIHQSELEQDTLAQSSLGRRNLARYQSAADWRSIIVALDGVVVADADATIERIYAELSKSGYLRETLFVVAGIPSAAEAQGDLHYLEDALPLPSLKKLGIVRAASYNGLFNLWLKKSTSENTAKILATLKNQEGIGECLILKNTGSESHYVRAFRNVAAEGSAPLMKWLDNAAGNGSPDVVATVTQLAPLGIQSSRPPFDITSSTGMLVLISPNLRLNETPEQNTSDTPVYYVDLFPMVSRALQMSSPPNLDGSNSALNGWLRE